ncbi:MAG: hypothetical protein ACRDO4_04300 [Nocardioides sp.]
MTAVALGVAACAGDRSSRAECEEAEAAGYPALEDLAETALPDVEYDLQRWSHCAEDDGGRAYPTVTVTLEKGQSKLDARALLVAAGWDATDGSEWVFRKGEFEASISGVAPPRRTEILIQPPAPLG